VLQAKMYADFYNAKNPPKKVDFLDAYVLTLKDRPHKPICAVEKFIEGEYKKYNNNWDWSDELRNTPQVFTHTALSLSLSLYRSLSPQAFSLDLQEQN
jgi:elongation factor 2 kinase